MGIYGYVIAIDILYLSIAAFQPISGFECRKVRMDTPTSKPII
jgi:hypothetical protein